MDPGWDEYGFPTSAEYIESQGLNLVEANRQLVAQSQELDQLSQFYNLLADPSTRDQALQLFDQEMAALQGQQGQMERPQFPGPNAAPYEPAGDEAQFLRAIEMVRNPAQYQQAAAEMNKVSPQFLAQVLLAQMPDV